MVIVGGGVIGLSVAYHLGRLGWSDVLLLERNELTGSMAIREPRPVADYLSRQQRFRHLFIEGDARANQELLHIQALADHNIKHFDLRGEGVDHLDTEVYLTHPERIAIPVQLVMGRKNHIFMPEGTLATYDWLRAHNDPELYELLDLPDYAHLDGIVGRNASREVYPLIFDFLDRHHAA